MLSKCKQLIRFIGTSERELLKKSQMSKETVDGEGKSQNHDLGPGNVH